MAGAAVRPEDCDKYSRCNANVCPFDVQVRRRKHIRGEPVCLWLREWSKPHGEARVRERLLENQADAVKDLFLSVTLAAAPENMGWGEIHRVLRGTAKTGSKIAMNPRNQGAPK